MESEYKAVAMFLRVAISLMAVVVQQIILLFKKPVHEKNIGAPRLFQLDPGCNTPCSKNFAVKLHWFSSWL